MKKYKIKNIQLVIICDRKYKYSGNDLYTVIQKNPSLSFVKTKDLLNSVTGEIIDIFGRKLITKERMTNYPDLYQDFVKTIIKVEPLELVFNTRDRNYKVSHDRLKEMVVKGYEKSEKEMEEDENE